MRKCTTSGSLEAWGRKRAGRGAIYFVGEVIAVFVALQALFHGHPIRAIVALNRADKNQGNNRPNRMSMEQCLQSDEDSNDFAKDEVDRSPLSSPPITLRST